MEKVPENPAALAETCVLLQAGAAADDGAVVHAIRSRGWTARPLTDVLAAFAELLLIEREGTSRAAWGLQSAWRSHLVIAGTPASAQLDELRHLCDAIRAHAPHVTIWVFEGAELRCVHEGAPVEAPAVDADANGAAGRGGDLRLTAGDVPGTADEDHRGEAARISSAELDMLFGHEAGVDAENP